MASERNAVHGEVDCGWRIFTSEGQTYLQMDTYGSAERELTGKVSQSVQIDGRAAAELLDILRLAFPELRHE